MSQSPTLQIKMALSHSKSKYNFIHEVPKNLKCGVCKEVAHDARQHETCGQLFCDQCVSHTKSCPYCKEEDPTYYQDKRGYRDIQALDIRCEKLEEGCQWEGTIETLQNHLSTECDFVITKCPNKCREGSHTLATIVRMMRKDLKLHLEVSCPKRPYRCGDCDKEGPYDEIMEHKQVCLKQIIQCKSANCGATFERGFTSQHIAECEQVIVDCKYATLLGCEVKNIRQELVKHENVEDILHLDCAVQKAAKLAMEIKTLKTCVRKLDEEKLLVLDESQYAVFKVEGIQDDGTGIFPYFSEPFYSHKNGYKLRIEVERYVKQDDTKTEEGSKKCEEESYISVYVSILPGMYDKQLHWPFLGIVKLSLLDQNNKCQHREYSLCFDEADRLMANQSWGYQKFISIKKLCQRSRYTYMYLLDGKMYFRASVRIQQHKPWLNCTLK